MRWDRCAVRVFPIVAKQQRVRAAHFRDGFVRTRVLDLNSVNTRFCSVPTPVGAQVILRAKVFEENLRKRAAAQAAAAAAAANAASSSPTTFNDGDSLSLLSPSLSSFPTSSSSLSSSSSSNSMFPFDDVIHAHLNNRPFHPPVTFVRQLLAATLYPASMNASSLYPPDVVSRAKWLLSELDNTTSPYGGGGDIKGPLAIRKKVAEYIRQRDGFLSDPEKIFLLHGSSDGLRILLNLLIRGDSDGILVPVPGPPLYASAVTHMGGVPLWYHLNEGEEWAVDVDDIAERCEWAREHGICPRAIIINNPSFVTGQLLTSGNIREVIDFCETEGLLLLAEETNQMAVVAPNEKFVSFKRIVQLSLSSVELVSFHSTSNSTLGEPGLRGGYMELTNISPDVSDALRNAMALTNMHTNIAGQVGVFAMCDPPRPGDPSFPLYDKEVNETLQTLCLNAKQLSEGLGRIHGISCAPASAAMGMFPSVYLGPAIREKARRSGTPPDVFYCMQLLEHTGLCVLPGSVFVQKPGSAHFSITFALAPHLLREALARISHFHKLFPDYFRQRAS